MPMRWTLYAPPGLQGCWGNARGWKEATFPSALTAAANGASDSKINMATQVDWSCSVVKTREHCAEDIETPSVH